MWIGIDPGQKGGVAAIYNDWTLEAHNCPATDVDMANLIIDLQQRAADAGEKVYGVLEDVHSFPGQGVASTFKFGMNYGTWKGIVAGLKMKIKRVTPGKWMSHFGKMPKDKTARKNHIKQLGQERFPEVHITLNTSDAVLLAVYARECVWAT